MLCPAEKYNILKTEHDEFEEWVNNKMNKTPE